MEPMIKRNDLLVSVLTCTKNRPLIITRAIKSILSQTHNIIEYIIIDASTNDETKKVVTCIKDDRIKYYSIKNEINLHTSLNYGLSKCIGKYIALQDDDDESLPTRIEKQVEYFESLDQRVGIIYCYEHVYDDKEKKYLPERRPNLRGNVFLDLLEKGGNTGGGTQLMFRKAVIDDVGGFEESLSSGSDYLWYLKASEKYAIELIPEFLIITHYNHVYARQMELYANNKDYIVKSIENINFLLNKYERTFNQYPQKRYYHYKDLAFAYSRLAEIKKSLLYNTKLLYLKPFALRTYKILIRSIINTIISLSK